MTEAMDSVALNRGRRNVTRVIYSDVPLHIDSDDGRSLVATPKRTKKSVDKIPKTVTTLPQTMTVDRVHKLAPARKIQGFLDIEAHFRRRIRDQDTAIQHIAASLSRALSTITENRD
jgi:hypothetical protein